MKRIDSLCEAPSGMINKLMLYACNTNIEMHQTNLIPALRQAIDLCRIGLPSHIRLVEQFRIEYAQVVCDPGQVQQVAINMINNAVQAIGDTHEGKIAIKVTVCPGGGCKHPRCPVKPERPDHCSVSK